MPAMAQLSRIVRRPSSRLLEAERRFFDAYSRGGDHNPRDLVVPITYFGRPDVARALRAWQGGSALDAAALERAWRDAGGEGEAERFYRNLSHFLSLV